MISKEKYNNALAALNAVLVHLRLMAYEKRSHAQMASALDAAEYLPRLMASAEDKTEAFRDTLDDLRSVDAGFGFALERFEREDLGEW